MLCKINHLGRTWTRAGNHYLFTETIPFLLFLCSATLAGDVPPTLAELKPIVSGAGSRQLLLFLCLPQRQPRVLFMTVLFHAS